MENQDKKSTPKPTDDAQSLVETIIPSTETEESKTTAVKDKISSETPQKPTEEKDSANENKNSADNGEEPTTEDEVKSDDKVTKEQSADEKSSDDGGDKIETVAP